MLNEVILHGRLTTDPDVKKTQGGTSVVSTGIAVQRDFANKNGEKEADFFNVTAFKNTADFMAKYFKKGSEIIIKGNLRTNNYEKDGQKRTSVSIIANQIYFAGSKSGESHANQSKQEKPKTAVETESVTPEEDLPF